MFCPLIRKNCIEHKCAWYCNVLGKDPQTNQDVNKWGCAITFGPMLQIELANQMRSTTASVDELRVESDRMGRAQIALQQIKPANVQLIEETNGL